MPRVTQAHRQARREEIAAAAARVLARRGLAHLSIAEIVKESGLSAGGIYANFENKAELTRAAAGGIIGRRVAEIDAATAQRDDRSPREVLQGLFASLVDDPPPIAVMLQSWGEATVEPGMHAVVTDGMGALRAAFERAVERWARQHRPDDPQAAARCARAMLVVSQGYLVSGGLFGLATPVGLLDDLTAALEPAGG